MRDRAETWLRSRAPMIRCPACGGANFGVADMIAMTNSIDVDTSRVNYMAGFPLLLVTCSNCAAVLMFSAKQIGIID